MTERDERLREQLDWVVGAPLTDAVKAEALITELSVYFDGGTPSVNDPLIQEARCLITLLLTPFTPTVRRYLHDRLHREG